MSAIRDFSIVARHDIRDSFRSKRVAVWIILYLLGSLAASTLFVYILKEVEDEAARMVSLKGTAKPGAMTASLWETDSFLNIVSGLVGDKELAKKLVNTPPIALFYGWLSMTFAPILVILLSSECISAELSSRSIRFITFRTSRLAWSLGKAAGQAILLLSALVFSGIAAWIVGAFGLSQFSYAATAISISELTIKTWFYSFAFLGLAMGVSQITKSTHLARGFGIIAFFVLSLLSKAADHYSGEGVSRLWELVLILTPQGHHLDLWRPEFNHQANALIFTVVLGLLYFFSGFFFFSRRDM